MTTKTGAIRVQTHKVDEDRDTSCPLCNAELSAATGLGGAAPKEGDFSVCAYCMGLLAFQKGPAVYRQLTEEERRGLPAEFWKKFEMMKQVVVAAGKYRPN